MINNPIPLVRISTVTEDGTVTDFATTYTQPITGKFYLEFDQAFVSNTNTSNFTRSTDTAIPMLTRTGGYVYTDMIAQAITLKKLGLLPMTCNPYRFRMVRMYNPDRVIFAECLPSAQALTSSAASTAGTTTTTSVVDNGSNPEVVVAEAGDRVASPTAETTHTTDLATLTF